MILARLRRRVKRHRASNPYSHTLFFFILNIFLGLLEIGLVGVVLVAAWLAGNALMKEQSQPDIADVAGDTKLQSAPMPQPVPLESPPEVSAKIEELADIVPAVAFGKQQDASSSTDNQEALTLLNEEWVLNQSRGSFTMQLGTSPDRDKLVAFAAELAADKKSYIFAYKVSRIGNPIYGLAVDLYPDLETALESIEKLPASYRQFDPWIRPLGELQDQIRQVKEQLAK